MTNSFISDLFMNLALIMKTKFVW